MASEKLIKARQYEDLKRDAIPSELTIKDGHVYQ